MTIQMFNITQTILGSVYASKEAAERLNAPEVMHQHAARRHELERLKQPKHIEEPEKTGMITLDPEKESGGQRRNSGSGSNGRGAEEDSMDNPHNPPPAHMGGLGDHIDIMS